MSHFNTSASNTVWQIQKAEHLVSMLSKKEVNLFDKHINSYGGALKMKIKGRTFSVCPHIQTPRSIRKLINKIKNLSKNKNIDSIEITGKNTITIVDINDNEFSVKV